jgi:multiple sugar transport system permease protein
MSATSERLPVVRSRAKPYRGDRRVGWLMLAPALIVLVGMAIVPIVYVVFYSFHRKNLFQNTPAEWVGFDNFKYLFEEPDFVASIKKMFIFAAVTLVVELALGFLLAALIYRLRDLPGMTIIRTILTTPILLAPIVTAFMWRFMYQPDFGVINYLLGGLGLPPKDWLADPDQALWAIAAIDIWQWTPFVFLVILAGMYGLPRQLYEAAELDGTPLLRQTLLITIPLLKRVLLIVVLLRLIDLLRVFDIIVGTTAGGPGNATATLPIQIWVAAFQEYQIGDAAASSLILLAIITVVVFVFVRLTARQGIVAGGDGR